MDGSKAMEQLVDQFKNALPSWKMSQPDWFIHLKEEAYTRFVRRGFPTIREEGWRQTPLTALTKIDFTLNGRSHRAPPALTGNLFEFSSGARLTFVDGHFSPELSCFKNLSDNTVISPLAKAINAHPELVRKKLSPQSEEENPFLTFNEAFMEEGAFVYLPKGIKGVDLIHILSVNTGAQENLMSHPRHLIILEGSNNTTLVESTIGMQSATQLQNSLTEIFLGENTGCDHYRLQMENPHAYSFAATQVHQERSSRYRGHSTMLGGNLTRLDHRSLLDGEGAECFLSGLFMGDHQQLLDHRIRVDHLKPYGKSDQIFRGILDGKSRGIFNGTVIVHQGARHSDAHQHIKNLLLSEGAEAYPEPQLKILNNDVKCSHGAAVGELDKNALFYLRSRGLSFDAARSFLTYAFAGEVLDHCRFKPYQKLLRELVVQRLPGGEFLEKEGALC